MHISQLRDISAPVLQLAAFSLLGKFHASALSAAKSIAFDQGFGIADNDIDKFNEYMNKIDAVSQTDLVHLPKSQASPQDRLNYWLAAASAVLTEIPAAGEKSTLANTAKFFIKDIFSKNRLPSDDEMQALATGSGMKIEAVKAAQAAKVKRSLDFELPLIHRALEIATDHEVRLIESDPLLDTELSEKVEAAMVSAKISAVKTQGTDEALASLMLINAEESLI